MRAIEGDNAGMFVGLTRTRRVRAGWIVALAYLFCVLAPTLSFALPGSHAVPHCLIGETHLAGLTPSHHDGMARHLQRNGHDHDHSGVQTHIQATGDLHATGDHHAEIVASRDGADPAKPSHPLDGQCCGVMCVVALLVLDISVAKPSFMKVARVCESPRKLTDNAPLRLYRPPIS
jgi:hypothetical protein